MTHNNALERFDEKFKDIWSSKHLSFIKIPGGVRLDMHKFIEEELTRRDEEILRWIEGMKKEMQYNAMVKMGDLSFGNYTPTGIYIKALSDLRDKIISNKSV